MSQVARARRLRRDSTPAERLLWRHLRNRGLEGAKFRRQQRVGRYIADFACEEAKLIVELDGGQHADQLDADAARTRYLEALGYRVMRFWNSDVDESLEGVLDAIGRALGDDRG